MQQKLKDLKKQQAKVKAVVEEKVLKGKNAKRPEESLEHVHELYRKYGQHLAEMEDKREAASGENRLKSEKRKALADKISKKQDVKPAIGQFSDWIVENRFETADVQHVINGPKGDRVVLQSPIKEKVKKPNKQLVGSKVNSNLLRKEYTNFGRRDESIDAGKKKHKKKVVLVRDGKQTDDSSEPLEDTKRDGKTTRIKDKQNKIVYANVAGHKLEFSSEKKRARLEAEKQDLEKSKENKRSNTHRQDQQDIDQDWKRDMQALKQKRAAEQSEHLDSEEIDFDDELLLHEIGKNSSPVLSQDRINYLEQFLASKAKKLGFYAASEAIRNSAILSRVISDQASQKIFLLLENIKKAAMLEQQMEDDIQPPAAKKKQRIETYGQPLSNFDRASEWPSSDQPYISSLRDEIMAAKQRREEEREREREFEESQRHFFEAKEQEEELRKHEAEMLEREKREEEQRIKQDKERRELEEKQRQEAEQQEKADRERKLMIEREQQERERIRKVREEMELIEKQQELEEEERLERERAERKKQGLGGRWDNRGGSDPSNKEDRKKPTATDKLREMNERLRQKEVEEKKLQLERQQAEELFAATMPDKPAEEKPVEPVVQTAGLPVRKTSEKPLELKPLPEEAELNVDLEENPEPIVSQQDVFELDDEELEGLKKDQKENPALNKEAKSHIQEPPQTTREEAKDAEKIDRSNSIPPKSLSSMPPIEEGEQLEDPEDQQVQAELDKLNAVQNSNDQPETGDKPEPPLESDTKATPDQPIRESKEAADQSVREPTHLGEKNNLKPPETETQKPSTQFPDQQEPPEKPLEVSIAVVAEVTPKETGDSKQAAITEGQAVSPPAPEQEGQLLSN